MEGNAEGQPSQSCNPDRPTRWVLVDDDSLISTKAASSGLSSRKSFALPTFHPAARSCLSFCTFMASPFPKSGMQFPKLRNRNRAVDCDRFAKRLDSLNL